MHHERHSVDAGDLSVLGRHEAGAVVVAREGEVDLVRGRGGATDFELVVSPGVPVGAGLSMHVADVVDVGFEAGQLGGHRGASGVASDRCSACDVVVAGGARVHQDELSASERCSGDVVGRGGVGVAHVHVHVRVHVRHFGRGGFVSGAG